MKNTLEELRNSIDELDTQLVQLLAKRMAIVKLVGEYKRKNNIPVFAPNRWQKVIENIQKKARKVGIDEKFILNIFDNIHTHAQQLEKDLQE